MDLRDYLESLSPEERNAWSEGPNSTIAARARPYTANAGLGADVVYRATSTPRASSTYASPSMVYGGAPAVAPTVSPVSTPPVDAGTWRLAVSTAAMALATAVANVIRSYPASPVTTSLFVTPLRVFAMLVNSPTRMTVDNARATLNAMAVMLSGELFISAGGAGELRRGLDRIIAMIPLGTSSPGGTSTPGGTTSDWSPGGGGGGWTGGPSSPGSDVTAPPGSSGPGPSTSGCPTNASPVAGGCMCNAGFEPNAAMDACVPISGAPPPPRTPPPSTSSGSGMGWLLLLGGAALAFRALGK